MLCININTEGFADNGSFCAHFNGIFKSSTDLQLCLYLDVVQIEKIQLRPLGRCGRT